MVQQRAYDPQNAVRLKSCLFASGAAISARAQEALLSLNDGRLGLKDYPTTNGIILVLPGNVYVNTRVSASSPSPLLLDAVEDSQFILVEGAKEPLAVEVLPLMPSALIAHPDCDGVTLHADRVRLSPIEGCAWSCAFCDSHLHEYRLRSIDRLIAGLRRVQGTSDGGVRHVLISGGTPHPEHISWLDEAYRRIVASADVPVDVMAAPRSGTSHLDRLRDIGVAGVSINLEIYDDKRAQSHCKSKRGQDLEPFRESLSYAVGLWGHQGQVRSLLLVGLEPLSATLQGVEFIASLGADPVLSPFVPARGTPLAGTAKPTADDMLRAWEEASTLAEKHGVQLGPRCLPCQHNTLAVPSIHDRPEF